jgi:transcription antitermination factor NusG
MALRRSIEDLRASEGVASVNADACWTVLWTKPRQEKEVARFLHSIKCKHYLPLIERVNFINGRRLVAEVPLFPSYVFCIGRPQDAYAAVATKRVCKVLPVLDQQRFQQEILQIRRALAAGSQLELYPFAVVGRRCRVTRGPLMGVEGVIVEHAKGNRLVLQVGILGRGAALEINVDLLEPVDD